LRHAKPQAGLTWNHEISGESFIAKAERYGAFAPHSAILEIGPGYGRLLRECLRRALPFREYVGVDISSQNVDYLQTHFARDGVQFLLGDIEFVHLDRRFDALLSSLTLKHLYPSFEPALRNVKQSLNPGLSLCSISPRATKPNFSRRIT
jgi:SAM-dependent methyltransferase